MSVYVPPKAAEKAGPVGPGAGVLMTEYLMPMMLPADPQRKMRMALSLGSEVSWIRAAERVISGKVGGDPDLQGAVKWHLEDPEGETIDEDYADPRAVEAYQLIAHPAKSLVSDTRQVSIAEYQGALWEITSRHMGLAGQGYWFLDELDGFGIPQGILYLRPDRLWPWTDDDNNLVAWSLDPRDPARPATGKRLELNEVIQFPLEAPGDGFLAQGLVESAVLKAQMVGALDKHIGSMVTSGGRLSGMFAPKGGPIENDSIWEQTVRDMRNISEQPDAAKRVQLLRFPMDYTRTQATIQEMAIVELMGKVRDDVLALWGVPLSQVGGSTATGLNSGDIRKYDEAALWQNAIVMRLVPMKQRIQRRLLDRFIPYLGWAPRLVLDIPEFDDDSPRYDKIQKAQFIALTNDQRREMIGYDPIDPAIVGPTGKPLGSEIWMPGTLWPVGISPSLEPTQTAAQQVVPTWAAGAPSPSQVALGASTGVSAVPGKAGPKLAKDDPRVNYRAATGSERCADCRFMLAGAKCALVDGVIEPDDVCDLYVSGGKAKPVSGPDVIPAVLAALRKQWPESELDIVRQGEWTFDPKFPIKKINADRRPIARNPKIVAGAEAVLEVGAPIAPITIIHTKVIGKKGYEPIDGWHRVKAAMNQGDKTIPAYVGEGDADWTTKLIAFDDDIPTPPDSAADEEPTADKAATVRSSLSQLRQTLEARTRPMLQATVALVLDQQRRDVTARVRTRYDELKRQPKDRSLWWAPGWDAKMAGAMTPSLQAVAGEIRDTVRKTLGERKAAAPVIAPQGAVRHVLDRGAARVTGINQTTADGLAEIIATGIAEGLSPADLGDAIEAWSGWDEYRAERIATTEMAAAYNAAALGSYDEVGVTQVVAVDGTGDDECASRDGVTFPIDEADTIEDHPNGTLAWDPVIGTMEEPA